jgi:DNA polymerase-3 subunit alpha
VARVGAGSIVTYLLEISNVDPIRYGLLFERFLNPERVNPPDIDIDFADDRRADVIEYVRQKYGRECVAQIITFGTMGAKSVVRDVGRVMGLTYGECDRLAKMIPTGGYHPRRRPGEIDRFQAAFEPNPDPRTGRARSGPRRLDAQRPGARRRRRDRRPTLVNLLPLKQDDAGAIVTQYAMARSVTSA